MFEGPTVSWIVPVDKRRCFPAQLLAFQITADNGIALFMVCGRILLADNEWLPHLRPITLLGPELRRSHNIESTAIFLYAVDGGNKSLIFLSLRFPAVNLIRERKVFPVPHYPTWKSNVMVEPHSNERSSACGELAHAVVISLFQ